LIPAWICARIAAARPTAAAEVAKQTNLTKRSELGKQTQISVVSRNKAELAKRTKANLAKRTKAK
jgi:hypothetical protein